jgi:uncharacterized protein (TIRG00374 family)
MKIKYALVCFGTITLFYLGALLWADAKSQIFTEFPKLLAILPAMLGLSLLSYFIRYLRWYWLLGRASNKTNFIMGCLIYFVGFAFTATPGKVGELLRIRYLVTQGVPSWKGLAVFVYEKAFDLIVVLLLSTLAITRKDVFIFAVSFVVIFLLGLVFIIIHSAWLTKISAYLRAHQLTKLARICIILKNGLSGCYLWLTPLDVSISMVLGLLAWSCTSLSFVLLLAHLGVAIPLLSAFAIYPLAMLVGAASMLPGGLGSTEAALIGFLSLWYVPLSPSTLAVIGIRFSSMWFAVFCGFIALTILEALEFFRKVGRRGN